MSSATIDKPKAGFNPTLLIFAILAVAGFIYFIYQAAGSSQPEKVWLAFLVNFLLFTALSVGAMLFATIMHFTKARWTRSLSGIAESFASFFPVSLILFLVLFLGTKYVFPWLGEDLHGKEAWLNIPFLFTRDLIGLLILYLLGLGFLYNSLQLRLNREGQNTLMKRLLFGLWKKPANDPLKIKKRMTYFAGWYMFVFALVLALIGSDLVMSMDPEWYSTLFGAYSFIKAMYAGFGALIIAVAVAQLTSSGKFVIEPKHFRDLSTLFFAFAIVWGDFFYAQFLVIWYGNIPEETSYIIERTMTAPWTTVAWTIFLICFILPFIILLRGKIKETPQLMIIVCSMVLVGFWLEHFLLLAPNYLEHASRIPIGLNEVVITIGFLSLFILSIILYLKQFPELLENENGEVA